MIEILRNKNNLTDSDITEEVIRVKAVIINSKNEVLLGYSHGDYQFPGGHVEIGENLNDALRREILEEVGLDVDTSNLEPFAINVGYYKDHPEIGKNRKIVIYYYEIFDDRTPNLRNTNYTLEELDGNFCLKYIPLDNVCNVLKKNADINDDKFGIAGEMLELFEKYLNE